MNWYRFKHTIRLCLTRNAMKRAEYIRKKNLFKHVGNNCMVMLRKLPLYSELISIGDNVWIASGVNFLTHDVTHHMLNYKFKDAKMFKEIVGCIKIDSNVFIGSGVSIMNNVHIGGNCIIGTGSIVTKSISGDGVYAGVPAKKISTFEEYLANRLEYSGDLQFLQISGEMLSKKQISLLWDSFNIRC